MSSLKLLLLFLRVFPRALKDALAELGPDMSRWEEASRKTREETRGRGWSQCLREGWEEGHREGFRIGRQQEHQRWEAWLKRRDEAEANNIAPVSFTHPAYKYMEDGDGDGVVCE